MSQSLRTEGIVLRRTNFGEADRILNVLTPDNGVVSAMAKSVRKEKSKLAGGIELFAVCDLNLHIGQGKLAVLTGARIKEFFSEILVDYDRLQFGYDVLKIVGRTADGVAESEFYNLTAETLRALNDLTVDLSLVRVWFYLHLANILGHGLNTAMDSTGMRLVDGARYDFSSEDEAFVFRKDGRFDARHIKFLRVLAQNKPEVLTRVEGVRELVEDLTELAQGVAKV